ncbi:MAG TPA: beta-ketoacyl-ACP synthase II [Bacillota bacterium]|nr:beta-ketoacyl-ACP synthase II [Bacillota bacterium]HQC82494.1 beta-ketoacyl-ACP synthase II [Bacillota bacterium]
MRRVAITGMGVVSPIGNDMETFRKNLLEGVCGIDYITRFDPEEYKVKIAAEVKDFRITDHVDKSEARRMDLFTQYAVVAAKEAISQSCILGTVEPEKFGVYIGSGIGGMDTLVNTMDRFRAGGPRKVSPLFIPMMISNMASGNIAIQYNAMGPCLPVVTACATSSHAIGEAYRAIRFGYADAIIAGGTEAAINCLAVAGFTNSMALSTRNIPNDSSIPFDARRDGFVIGEGAGVVIMEDYEHAKNRGAKILGEIVGYANTCDAYHITAPHPEAEGAANAIRLALEEAGYTKGVKLYYNAHGTSTPLNDKVETLALKKVLGEDGAREIYISSTKSMTGHMLGAAGAVEAIACLIALETGEIPPTIGYKELDPECDLNYTPNVKAKVDVEMAVSTSLGFGGHNAVLVIRKGDR